MKNNDERSPLAIGYIWSTRIITISMEVVLLILGFHWLDNKLKISPVLTVVGAFLGMVVFIYHLIALTKNDQVSDPEDSDRENKNQ